MLPEEYERRRELPRHLRPAPREEAEFSYTIRPAREEDLPAVRAIYRHYVLNSSITFDETPKTLAKWRTTFAQLTKLSLPFLVAESGTGTVLGYALVQPWKQKSAYRYTVENSIYLAPTATGRGLGRALLTALIDAAIAAGCKEMIAVIADQQASGSIWLHEQLGFRETGRMGRVGFKFGRWLGVVMLQRSLRSRR